MCRVAKKKKRKRKGIKKIPHLRHCQVVESVRAVEHDAPDGKRSSQVLHRFRLAGASWALRRAVQVQPVRADQRPVTAVRQRRDHQPGRVTQILICVTDRRVCDSDHDAVVLPVVPAARSAEICVFVLLGYLYRQRGS